MFNKRVKDGLKEGIPKRRHLAKRSLVENGLTWGKVQNSLSLGELAPMSKYVFRVSQDH